MASSSVPKGRGRKKRTRLGLYTFSFTPDEVVEEESVAHFARTSADGRRQYREEVFIAGPSPEKLGTDSEAPEAGNNDVNEVLEHTDLLEVHVAIENAMKPRSRRYLSSVGGF